MKTEIETLIGKLREKATKENRKDLESLANWYTHRLSEETENGKLFALKSAIQKQLR
jgi:hypothetical protein